MHGGLKVYRGSPAAARSYVEAGRGRADDYYLAEGTGIAWRYVASPEGVRAGGTLTGDGYEAWVGGFDPDTGAAKGRLRTDAAAVRFVEVVVNGPKTWSLAAALHPDIAQAYDGAQDRAAVQIIGWLAQHATTRVGPRGRQVQVPARSSKPSQCGTTPPVPATRIGTCTCRSTPGSWLKAGGGVCTPSGSATAWMRSMASVTAR